MDDNQIEEEELPLVLQKSHMLKTYSRWTDMRNNTKNDHELKLDEQGDGIRSDDWYFEQCGGCTYYLPLEDPNVIMDWGLCTNGESVFDRTVMFEHDGCDKFTSTANGNWVDSFLARTKEKRS
jgi:hypothetical protein